MPTLQELTLEHSRRLSEVYRTRDVRIAQAQAARDLQLRALPGAARAFQKYDDELAAAREKQLATDGRAEAARSAALTTAADRRSDRLEDAQAARRAADVDAIAARRRAEEAAEAKFLAAAAGARDLREAERARVFQDAERTRRVEIEQARRAHDQALVASQQQYRAAVEEAVTAERRDGRDGERGYFDALRFGDAAGRAARSAADQNLQATLIRLDAAREVLREWRLQLAAINAETASAEADEFARFRRELEKVGADG